jgi:hypothetical protein
VASALGNLTERPGAALGGDPAAIPLVLAGEAGTDEPQPERARGPRGWGFFVVERAASAAEAADRQHLIEIALCREGDAPPGKCGA